MCAVQDGSGDAAKAASAGAEDKAKPQGAATATDADTALKAAKQQAESSEPEDEPEPDEDSGRPVPKRIVIDGRVSKHDQQAQQNAKASSAYKAQHADLDGYSPFVNEEEPEAAHLPLKFASLDVDDAESRSTTLGGSRTTRQTLEGQQAPGKVEAEEASGSEGQEELLSGDDVGSKAGVDLTAAVQLTPEVDNKLQQLADQQTAASIESGQQDAGASESGDQAAAVQQRPEVEVVAVTEPQIVDQGMPEHEQDEDPSWT